MNCTRVLFSYVFVGVLGLSVFAALPARAQEDPDDEPPSQSQKVGGGGGFFGVGVNSLDLKPLNQRLSRTGYPTFPSELFAIGGGGYGVVAGNLLLGGHGYGLIAPSRGFQGREVSVGGGYGLFTIGYQFQPATPVAVFPQVGIGGGGLSLDIGSTGTDSFEDVLDDPNREASLEKGSLLVSVGVGMEYRFSKPGESGGFQIGVRAGYLLSPYDTDWTHSGDRLSGGPDASFGGPYVRLVVGGWGDGEDDD